MIPRSYQAAGNALHETFNTMLQKHPEAFDCIIFPAKSSEHNEVIADNEPVGTLLDRGERAQEYAPPVAGRAMIVPNPDLSFAATSSGLFESFHSTSEAIQMVLSISGLRTYSLILWREYISLNSEETVERIVYVSDIKPIGRNLGAGMIYICRPLIAEGEMPKVDIEQNTISEESPVTHAELVYPDNKIVNSNEQNEVSTVGIL